MTTLQKGGENDSEVGEEKIEEEEAGEGKDTCKKKSYTHPHKRDYSDIPAEEIIELYPSEDEMKGARFVKKTSSYRFLYIPGRLVKIQYDRYIYCKDGRRVLERHASVQYKVRLTKSGNPGLFLYVSLSLCRISTRNILNLHR